MADVNRDELAGFLHAKRDQLKPTDVGLPSGQRRRTPGLRRQEVAELAGMSIDYYIRLEQARGPKPSKQVLSALSRALMLTADEREYLFRIAGEVPPHIPGPSAEVEPGIRHLLDSMHATPAYVVDAKYDVLAWNRLAELFVGDLSVFAQSERNMIRWIFTRPTSDSHWDDEQSMRFARGTVADLRAAYAQYPGDPGINALVTELLAISPQFAEHWARHEVKVRRRMIKKVTHTTLGPLEFECQLLHIPDTDQRIIVYCAEPGSPTSKAFEAAEAELASH